jgi:hypothetical protein
VNEVSAFLEIRHRTAVWAKEVSAKPVFAQGVLAEAMWVEAAFASGPFTKPGPTKVALGERSVACLLARSPFFGSGVADNRWRKLRLEKHLVRYQSAKFVGTRRYAAAAACAVQLRAVQSPRVWRGSRDETSSRAARGNGNTCDGNTRSENTGGTTGGETSRNVFARCKSYGPPRSVPRQ